MTQVNGCCVPSCAELAKMLECYGDQPLFSGNGWYVVNGLQKCSSGIQIYVTACAPEGQRAKDRRDGGL